jgi:hypothetical protein
MTHTGLRWLRPKRGSVEVKGAHLVSLPAKEDAGGHVVEDPVRDFLLPFAALCDSKNFDADVVAYAERWGVLGICDHGLPHTHWPLRLGLALSGMSQVANGNAQWCRPATGPVRHSGTPAYVEPLDSWLMISRQAKNLLLSAAALHRGSPIEGESWEILSSLLPTFMTARPPGAVGRPRPLVLTLPSGEQIEAGRDSCFENEQLAVAFAIRTWLELGDVRAHFSWDGAGPSQFGFAASTLFGGLALRLAMVSTRAQGVKVCDYCHQLYEPTPGERRTTRSCKSPGCEAARNRANGQRHRQGQATTRGPYKPRTSESPKR